MERRVLVVLLILGAVVAGGNAQVVIRGILEAGPQPFPIDSVMIESRASRQWFPCPGWAAEPMSQDTFVFPAVPEWPELIRIAAFVEGQPIDRLIPMPRREEWYHFDPPFEQTRVKFQDLAGIETRSEPWSGRLVVEPTLVRQSTAIVARTAGTVEVFDAAGNVVLSLAAPVEVTWDGSDQSGRPLAGGIYFCRLTSSTGSMVCRVVLVR